MKMDIFRRIRTFAKQCVTEKLKAAFLTMLSLGISKVEMEAQATSTLVGMQKYIPTSLQLPRMEKRTMQRSIFIQQVQPKGEVPTQKMNQTPRGGTEPLKTSSDYHSRWQRN